MRMLHCTMNRIALTLGTWRIVWKEAVMAFLTEFFVRPRPQESLRYRAAFAVLQANGDRHADTVVKPADFPRIARERSRRAASRTRS